MFPLGSVLVPHQVLPLRVFEPRYLALVDRCVASDRRFGVVLIERGSEVGGGDVRFPTGTVARIEQVESIGPRRLGVVAVGAERLRVRAWRPDAPYPLADVEILGADAATPDPAGELDALTRAWARLMDAVRARGAGVPAYPPLSVDPVVATWELVARAPVTPLDAYAVLGEDDPAARITRLIGVLGDVAELLEADRP